MLAQQRQDRIVEIVARDGAARVPVLVHTLGVSDMTVRRDLDTLAEQGLVARVHGGVTAVRGSIGDEPGFATNSRRHTAQKRAIGVQAAGLVEPGSAVAISAGTTTCEVARALRGTPSLTVVTNSLPAAQLFCCEHRQDQTVIVVGGERTPSDALVGPVAVHTLERLHVDWLFVGAQGIDDRAGLTTLSLAEAETNRALIGAADRIVCTVDSTKWGVVGLSSIARLDDVDILVSDDGLPGAARDIVRDRVGAVLLADSTRTPGSAHQNPMRIASIATPSKTEGSTI